jgi:chromosome partitioning protein
MVVTLCGQKGGAGKTTVVTNLIPELLTRNRRVLLVDADVQGSARTWADRAARAGQLSPAIAVVAGVESYDLFAVATWISRALPELLADFDDVVIDCPGALNGSASVQAAAIGIADIALIPAAEDAFSAWSMAATAKLVRNVQRARPLLLAYGLVEGVDLRRRIGEQTREHIAKAGLPALKAQMLDRAEYVEAPGFLMGASTYKPKSEAAKEVVALVDELLAVRETTWLEKNCPA